VSRARTLALGFPRLGPSGKPPGNPTNIVWNLPRRKFRDGCLNEHGFLDSRACHRDDRRWSVVG
jgi:hypothetical protein